MASAHPSEAPATADSPSSRESSSAPSVAHPMSQQRRALPPPSPLVYTPTTPFSHPAHSFPSSPSTPGTGPPPPPGAGNPPLPYPISVPYHSHPSARPTYALPSPRHPAPSAYAPYPQPGPYFPPARPFDPPARDGSMSPPHDVATTSPSGAPSKRKRKSDGIRRASDAGRARVSSGPESPDIVTLNNSPGTLGPSMAANPPMMTANQQAASSTQSKRTKTQRACDKCRTKKIRCDVIPNSNPPICQHCKQYNLECTFYLPITETRFKKRKLEEDQQTHATASSSNPKPPIQYQPQHQASPLDRRASDTIMHNGTQQPASLQRHDSTGALAGGDMRSASRASSGGGMAKGDVKIYGPTSLTYILHASANMPSIESFDVQWNQTWNVGRSGSGFIQVREEGGAIEDPHEGDSGPTEEGDANALSRGNKPSLEREMLERLVNYYFKHIAHLFPVITEAEFLASGEDDEVSKPISPSADPQANANAPSSSSSSKLTRASPLLLYAICTIAATARHVPLHIFEKLRSILNMIIRRDDVLSNASLENIQALLIIGMTGEPHNRVTSHGMSAAFLRVSTAIRMAQDLGLHRAEAVKSELTLRRRLWGACVVMDRFYSLVLGLPQMIDVHDCDARLPGPERRLPSAPPMTEAESEEALSLLFMGELVKLAVLAGKVSKTIYTPTGLMHTTDEQLEALLADLDYFRDNIPSELVFHGAASSIPAGILHLFYTCVCMMFWRVFMRISYTCPEHLKFSLTVERWTWMKNASADGIEWLDQHETVYDSWVFVAYAITCCALVQYHTWARRKDTKAADSLKQLRDCVKRWENTIERGHMGTRLKTTEIISLLYEATQSPVTSNFWTLNPTVGVEKRGVPNDGITWQEDSSRPGGGLFIATQKTASQLGAVNMPAGTMVIPDQENTNDATTPDRPPFPREAGDMSFKPSGMPVQASDMFPPQPSNTQGYLSNMNPNLMIIPGAMGQHQVLNTLDQPAHPNLMSQYAAANDGLLDGIPGSMFDWDQWQTFFSRFQVPPSDGGSAAPPLMNDFSSSSSGGEGAHVGNVNGSGVGGSGASAFTSGPSLTGP